MKQPGHCTLCEQAIFEIKERTVGGPLDGLPRKLGAPHEDAFKVTLLLMNGTLMDLSFCGACLPEITQALPKIWGKVLEAFGFEREVLAPEMIRLGRRAPLSAEQVQEEARNLITMMAAPPVGVLAAQRFTELMNAKS